MALEALKGVTKLGKHDVMSERPKKEDGQTDWTLFDEQRKTKPVFIDQDVNMISFRIQDGPVKENGLNGCQLDTMIEAAKIMLEGLNVKFPCRENSMAITKLDECLMWLDKRTKDREARNVEGESKL